MIDLKSVVSKLNKDLDILLGKARDAGNAPPELLSQIEDHKQAITVTQQALAGDLTLAKWREAIQSLPSAIDYGEVVNIETRGGAYIEGTVNTGGDFVGRDNIHNIQINYYKDSTEQQHAPDDARKVMLQTVEKRVKGVLENSLHNAVLIELEMEEKKDAIESPWGMVLQSPDQPNRLLPHGTKMIDVFDRAVRSLLLILGEPGSGKTTMLLELAQKAIDRAVEDSTKPIPVVFHLSSWTIKRLPLDKWLVEELNTKHKIPKEVARQWVKHDELLLLLDGLDEVATDHRVACVRAINDFIKECLMSVVVCSRVDDYKAIPVKLSLDQTLTLQPLTLQQITGYLAKLETDTGDLQAALQQDSQLRELAKSPLMLSIMILAYDKVKAEDLSEFSSLPELRKHLLDMYVSQMFKRRRANQQYPLEKIRYWLSWLATRMGENLQKKFDSLIFKPLEVDHQYPEEKIRHWLSWLAQRMRENSQTEFIIEEMQPDLLKVEAEKILFQRLLFLLLCLIPVLSFGLVLLRYRSLISFTPLLVFWWYIVLMTWFLVESKNSRPEIRRIFQTIKPTETLKWSWSRHSNKMVMFAVFVGLYGGLFFGVVSAWLSIGLYSGLKFGLIVGPIIGLIIGLVVENVSQAIRRGKVEIRLAPNQGTWLSLGYGAAMGLMFGLIFGLISWRSVNLSFGLFTGLAAALLTGLYFGVFAFIQHFVLRFLLWRKGYLPWDYARFLDYAAEHLFLQKVGGGYQFVHEYFREYFASLESGS